RVAFEAGGGVEGGAGTAGEEGVAAGQVRGLCESVNREATCAIEPHLVLRALERGEQREAVARGAVADPVPFLGAGRACSPDELGAGEQQLLVDVIAGGGDDSRRGRAPLKLALAAPVGEPV